MRKIKLPVVSLALLLVGGCAIFTSWSGIRLYQESQTEAFINALVRPETIFPLTLKWKTDLEGYTYDPPAYQSGLVLIPTNKGRIISRWHGIDAVTGRLVWSQAPESFVFLHCLTDQYVVLSSPWSFLALKTRTGERIWTKNPSYAVTCSERVVYSSGVPRDSITAFDLPTGLAIWETTTPTKSFFGVVYNHETEEIVAGHAEEFYVIEASSGYLQRSFTQASVGPTNGDRSRGPMYVIDRGELFIAGTVQDAQTGQVIHREERFGSMVSPTVTTDTMYLPAIHDGVVTFARATYEIKWIYPAPQHPDGSGAFRTLSQVAILNGIGYIIFSDATVRAFDLESGQELGYWQPNVDELWAWRVCTYPEPRFDCIEEARAGLATAEDTLFVSFGDGKLYAFGEQ